MLSIPVIPEHFPDCLTYCAAMEPTGSTLHV
jgi:hypothetical protein